jgi:anti-sigma regulatory factor (Ser/Thr protein kinase)
MLAMARNPPDSDGVAAMSDAGERWEAVSLTLPGDGRYVHVARIVVGGLAARLDLSYENLDDLQLAVESVLGNYLGDGDVTIQLVVRDRAIEVLVAPVDEARIRADLDHLTEGFTTGVLLSRVVDAIGFEERDGARWLRLTKQVPVSARES